MNVYPVLQSGFVSLVQQGLRRPDIIEPSLREAVIFKEYKLPLAKYFYSPEVSELYARWCSHPDVLKDFDFRERLIQATVSSFGNASFYKWLQLQVEKPTVSDLHKAFLIETLQYLYEDKPRSIQNVQWIRLLEANEECNRVKIDIDHYFGPETLGQQDARRLPISLGSIIRDWTKKERGFEDLLICLYVIFGDRSRRTDMSDATS